LGIVVAGIESLDRTNGNGVKGGGAHFDWAPIVNKYVIDEMVAVWKEASFSESWCRCSRCP
jgi:hypothetical protein